MFNVISKLITIFWNVKFILVEKFSRNAQLRFVRIEESYAEDCRTGGRVRAFTRILIPNYTVSRLKNVFKHRFTNISPSIFCANVSISNNRLVSPFLQVTKALRDSRVIALLCF
jgi:hypothetical protein